MLSLAIIFVGLVVGFVFFRKQTNKILLVVALSIAIGGALRLVEMVGHDEGIVPALIAFGALGAIWLVAWLLNRSVTRKPTSKLASKARSGPPRVDLR
jgi:hypothetical protein